MNSSKILLIIPSLFYLPNLHADDVSRTLEPVIVTANPLERPYSKFTQPVTVLSGSELNRKLEPTIGETLTKEVGVRSTYYGPNASRPVIRGLGGDQISILQNGVGNLDASTTSADHNIAIDPLSAETIEILRGPAALLYGSKAVGGVVNIIDNRIPNKPIEEKVTGVTDLKYNSANNERSAAILLEGGVENYAWHLNSFKRSTDNIDIPGYARSSAERASEPLEDGEGEERDSLDNSQSDTHGVTVGVSRFFDKGYYGISYTNYNSDYGVPGYTHSHEEHGEEEEEEHEEEENTTIDMKQHRLDIAGMYEQPIEQVKSIKYKIGFSNYKHQEIAGGIASNIFKNNGFDSRIEIAHNEFGPFEGAFGVQSSKSDFSTSGAESFLPSSTTYTNSAFIYEELPLDKLSIQLGARIDFQDIRVDQDAAFTDVESKDELTTSASLGASYQLPKDYFFVVSTFYTERAANAEELYSNGEHHASQTYEVGDQNLDVQKSVGLDVSLRRNSKNIKGEVNLYYNYFQDFITSTPTGEEDSESEFPIYNYVNLPAEFFGLEAKAIVKSLDTKTESLSFEVRGDYVEGRNRETSEDLPRIAPARIGASAIYERSKTSYRIDADYTFKQTKVASYELPTDGYTMLGASIEHKFDLGSTSSIFYIKGSNLLNQEARNHVSFLKDTVPLPARSGMIGIKTFF